MDEYGVIPSYIFVRRSWCKTWSTEFLQRPTLWPDRKWESYRCALMLRSRLVALPTGAQIWGACQALARARDLESTDTRMDCGVRTRHTTNLQVKFASSDHDVCWHGANEQATRFSTTLTQPYECQASISRFFQVRQNLALAGELILISPSIPMDNTFDKTAVETIDLLEARLKRIEYAVCGHVGDAGIPSNKPSASKRLADLEHSLHQLASKSRVVQDLLRLRESPWVDFQSSC